MSKEIIHEAYEKIVTKIIKEGHIGLIYGEPIDPDNIEHLVVSAYFIAQQEERDRQAETNEIWAAIARLK